MKTIDISYKNYKKSDDIHGTALYPAVMVGPAQKDILMDLIDKNVYTKIIDPFHGSGTALYEAATISPNLSLVGYDINPLANLITKVKMQGVDTDNIKMDIAHLTSMIKDDTIAEKHSFPNANKWFREDIIIALSKIRTSIMQIKNYKNRLFFWYILSDVVRKHSNTRSSTYKLYSKKQADILNINNNVIENYIESINTNYRKFFNNYENFDLKKGDTLNLIKENKENEFDICITSPPYGDNATTVTYGQFSMLPLNWIDKKDLELEGWEYENYSVIDSKSMGGCMNIISNNSLNMEDVKSLIDTIPNAMRKKVITFFDSYFLFLEEISRVTKHYVVMTLGHRIVGGKRIELTSITVNKLNQLGFSLKMKLEREIFSKRTPKIIAYSKDGKPIDSMNKEYVIIMEKCK